MQVIIVEDVYQDFQLDREMDWIVIEIFISDMKLFEMKLLSQPSKLISSFELFNWEIAKLRPNLSSSCYWG